MKKENKNRKDIDFECTCCADPYNQCPYATSKPKNEKSDSKSIDNFWTRKTFTEKMIFAAHCFFGIQFILYLLSVIVILSGYFLRIIGVNVQFPDTDLAWNKIILGIICLDFIVVFVGILIYAINMFFEDYICK